MERFVSKILSPIGPLWLVSDGTFITGLHYLPRAGKDGSSLPLHTMSADQLADYFGRGRQRFDLPLRLEGTDFRRRVWQELEKIPYGETITYGELARRVGSPGASRAVGQANHHNPISIIIPCHRVIGASGKLIGYGGGLDRKQFLLELEGNR